MKIRHRLLRLLGVVSPSGAYPLPPRWAMSRKGRALWYPEHPSAVAYGPGSVAAGGNIGNVVTGAQTAAWASDVARGPLTRFSTGEPQHECGERSPHPSGLSICDRLGCFAQQPYVALRDREGGADRAH
ncbi:hypothetical protein SEA_MISCHIEF19_29 [Streptomyces phage Mischief19]|nr:hypothetical protein SEA_MISCHIEF19_29 [Streptomyces phage Mischief19]